MYREFLVNWFKSYNFKQIERQKYVPKNIPLRLNKQIDLKKYPDQVSFSEFNDKGMYLKKLANKLLRGPGGGGGGVFIKILSKLIL